MVLISKPELPDYVRDTEIKYALKQFVKRSSVQPDVRVVSTKQSRLIDDSREELN